MDCLKLVINPFWVGSAPGFFRAGCATVPSCIRERKGVYNFQNVLEIIHSDRLYVSNFIFTDVLNRFADPFHTCTPHYKIRFIALQILRGLINAFHN